MSQQTTPTQQAFIDALERLIEESPSEALPIITGAFVGTVVCITEAYGHETSGEIRIDGGKERDITIHAPKTDISTGF